MHKIEEDANVCIGTEETKLFRKKLRYCKTECIKKSTGPTCQANRAAGNLLMHAGCPGVLSTADS